MIRINLLGRARPRVRRPIQLTGPWLSVLLVVPLLVVLVYGFVRYYGIDFGFWAMEGLEPQITRLKSEIQELEAKKLQMANVQQEMQRLDAEKAKHEARLEVIRNLERNQAAPVLLLDGVGRMVNLSETVWLTSMVDQGGGKIELKGVAASVEAVANLMTNLGRSQYFKDIEIKETAQQGQGELVSLFEFSLSVTFEMPAPEPEAGQETEAQPTSSAAGGP